MKNRRIIIPVKQDTERRIIIDTDENGVRAALLENGEPVEFMSSASGHESNVGNIYLARVETVTKSNFVFVDAGLERNAFLNLNDNKDADKAGHVKPGSVLAVQVQKDAIRDKGAYVSTRLTWPGRFFVVESIPEGDGSISVSKKITAQRERDRLTSLAAELLSRCPMRRKNLIIRTEAINAAPSILESELSRLADAVRQTEGQIIESIHSDISDIPRLVYKPYPSSCAMMAAELMAAASYNVGDIVLNSSAEHALLSDIYAPMSVKVLYQPERLFEHYRLDKLLESTRHRLVPLPSGGHIVIERTEACIVIDVNSAQYAGHKSMENMALKINLEAARETARQLRLRNLSGVIIIDFIGMNNPDNITVLTEELKNACAYDKALTTVEGMTKLGLMEMTRKRARVPLWS